MNTDTEANCPEFRGLQPRPPAVKSAALRAEKHKSSAGVLLLLLLWMLLAFYFQEKAGKPFPYPWEAVKALFLIPHGDISLFLHAGISLLRWTAGYAIASAAGLFFGVLMWRFPLADRLASPFVATVQLIPGLAWVPIALIIFGLGNDSAIFMITMTAVAPVILNTRSGIHQIDITLLRVGEMMELSEWQRFRKIILPGAAPSIISGLRVAAANGFRVLISAEMIVGSASGLGFSMYQSRWTFDYAAAFGALLLIIVIGLIIERVIFFPLEKQVLQKRGLL